MPVTRQAAAALMTSPTRRRQLMPHDNERDYEVGYGRPPRHTRFELGRSGNPRGRPGGSKNLLTLLNEALKEPVIVVENGRRRKIAKRQAIITQLVNRSAKADLKAIQILLTMLRDIEGRADPGSADPAGFTEADQQIIQLPPRHLKSLLASIAFPAWCLGHDPSAQILSVSYGQELADKLARDCRSIVMSPWYRQIFPTRLAPHRQAVQEFITTRQGYRLATSTGGVLTGRGADLILIDDPLKPEEALSEAQRQTANDWYDHTLYSRLNDKRHGVIVIIMQRLHEDDLVGHVLAQEPWEVLSFPAIAEADEVHRIETIWGPRCFRRRQGEALHPDREPLDILDRIRRTIGEYNFAGQYQQSPAPLGGGL